METLDQYADQIRTSVKTIDEYNDTFSHDLTSLMFRSVMVASRCKDAPLIAMRNSETLDAAIRFMVVILASTEFYDTPSNLQKFAEQLKKDILRRVPKAKQDNADIIATMRSGYVENMRTDGVA